MNVVIVDLVRKIGRSSRIGVDVESNKGERALMAMAVRADESAFAEAHVCLICHGRADTRERVRSGPASANMRQTHETVEVCNLRRIIDHIQRFGGIQRVVVNEDSERGKWRYASRNRIGLSVFAMLLVIIVAMGIHRRWRQETGSERRARSPEKRPP